MREKDGQADRQTERQRERCGAGEKHENDTRKKLQ